MLCLGADIGGTFTDAVAFDTRSGRLSYAKALSTPDSPERGVMDALKALATQRGEPLEDMLANAESFLHGTTVTTNTLAEGTGPRVGLITTRGFRDVLELRDGTKRNRYSLREPFAEAIIPRELRLEVSERTDWDGSVSIAVDEGEARDAVRSLVDAGVEVIVVGFLHSNLNPSNEIRMAEILAEQGWSGHSYISHKILNRRGEYQRFSTSAVNAIVTPRLERYLGLLGGALNQTAGRELPLMVMQSSGGLVPAAAASSFGVGCVTSGPAGGAIAAAFLARTLSHPHAVGFDIGGTTTDISLIENARPVERLRSGSDAYVIAVPSIDIRVDAIGGGSIAGIDSGGVLYVGPRSSGSVPGPACYGRGGRKATVTDAAAVLGLLDDGEMMGSSIPLSRALAVEAIERDVAGALGLSVEDAALAVYRLATVKVAEGIRATTVGRGIDPRELLLVGFGGAGGLYVDAVSRELQMPKAVAPRAASVFSAFGFLAAPVRFDDGRTVSMPLGRFDAARLRETLGEMRAELDAKLAAAGVGEQDRVFEIKLDCRYLRQTGTVETVLEDDDLMADTIRAVFEKNYEDVYKHRHAKEECIVEVCRVSARGVTRVASFPVAPGVKTPEQARRGMRRIYGEDGWHDWPVYDFEVLAPGSVIAGPLLLQSATTTIAVQAGKTVTLDEFGNAILEAAQE